MPQEFFGFVIGTGNDMNGNQFADAARSSSSRFGCSFHGSDIASDQHGDIPVEEVFAADQHNIRRLHHRIGSLDGAYQSKSFNHAERFHAREPTRIAPQKQLTPGNSVPYDSVTYMSNFGTNFTRAREAAGLSLEKIAAETRISTRFLVAIENEEFDLLPGGVFNRGFIRSYAERVGINPDQAIADYEQISVAVEEPVEELRNVERASMSKSDRNLYALAAGLLAVLIIVFYVVTRNRSAGSAVQPTPNAATETAPAPDATTETAPTPDAATETTPAPDAGQPKTAGTVPDVVQPKAAAPPAAATSLVVDLNVKDLSWIKVTTDGNVALSDNLTAGTNQRFTATSSIDLAIGNAAGVSLTINGREVGTLGQTGQVREITITPQNAAQVR